MEKKEKPPVPTRPPPPTKNAPRLDVEEKPTEKQVDNDDRKKTITYNPYKSKKPAKEDSKEDSNQTILEKKRTKTLAKKEKRNQFAFSNISDNDMEQFKAKIGVKKNEQVTVTNIPTETTQNQEPNVNIPTTPKKKKPLPSKEIIPIVVEKPKEPEIVQTKEEIKVEVESKEIIKNEETKIVIEEKIKVEKEQEIENEEKTKIENNEEQNIEENETEESIEDNDEFYVTDYTSEINDIHLQIDENNENSSEEINNKDLYAENSNEEEYSSTYAETTETNENSNEENPENEDKNEENPSHKQKRMSNRSLNFEQAPRPFSHEIAVTTERSASTASIVKPSKRPPIPTPNTHSNNPPLPKRLPPVPSRNTQKTQPKLPARPTANKYLGAASTSGNLTYLRSSNENNSKNVENNNNNGNNSNIYQQFIASQRELEKTKAQLAGALQEIAKLNKQVKRLKKQAGTNEGDSAKDKFRGMINNAKNKGNFLSLRPKQNKHVYKFENGFGEEEFSLNDNFWDKKKKKIVVRVSETSINEKLVEDVGGSCAKLYVANVDGMICVLKELDIKFAAALNLELLKTFESECMFLESIPLHNNIVRYLFHELDEEQGKLRIYMTKYSCTLRNIINQKIDNIKGKETRKKGATPIHEHKFTAVQVETIFLQVLKGLSHLHKNEILHRDMKSDNIFCQLDAEYEVKEAAIGDFDTAKYLHKNELAKSIAGTPGYIAPEVWKKEPYSFAADIYSVGIILYEMLNLKRPYEGEKGVVIQDKLAEQTNLPFDLPEKELEEYKFLIVIFRMCTQTDPIVRPSADHLIDLIQNRRERKL